MCHNTVSHGFGRFAVTVRAEFRPRTGARAVVTTGRCPPTRRGRRGQGPRRAHRRPFTQPCNCKCVACQPLVSSTRRSGRGQHRAQVIRTRGQRRWHGALTRVERRPIIVSTDGYARRGRHRWHPSAMSGAPAVTPEAGFANARAGQVGAYGHPLIDTEAVCVTTRVRLRHCWRLPAALRLFRGVRREASRLPELQRMSGAPVADSTLWAR